MNVPSFARRPLIFLVIILFSTGFNAASAQTPRVRENFDFCWQFHKGDIAIKRAVKAGRQGGLTDADVKVIEGEEAIIAYTDKNKVAAYKASDWTNVNLPHDWLIEEQYVHDDNISSQPAGNGYLPTDIGFYRKEFEIESADLGKSISIEFDGIFRNSTVWVNGNLMGNHKSGYTPSFYDLTNVLRYGDEGKNVILVKVDATDTEGWWYEGCGIYRHVWMTKTAPLHVARFGTFITTPSITSEKAVVSIKTTIENEEAVTKVFQVISRIMDAAGNIIDTQTISGSTAPLSSKELSQTGSVARPKLWSPETPNLYKIQTEVIENGAVTDNYETIFGIRTVEITTNGFFLNGKAYPIKGTANHQDFSGVGVALPDKINWYKIKLLKEMGSNGYRTAHNPPTPEVLDICDREGMLVLDENRLLTSTPDGLEELKTLMLRDRNHPSVFMWCLENEESLEGKVAGTSILKKMAETARQLDPTRPVTAAMNHGWNEGGYADVIDVVGYNYGQRGMQYVKDHEKYPSRKMFVTESTSYVSTRGEYVDDKEKGYVSNFGKGISWGLQPGQDWKHIVLYPFLSGTFVWTGFDYRGEPTPYRWPCVSSHFGIMDLCGFPKDGYYGYKAAWTDQPIVHVFPHWNWPGKEGQKMKFRGYSNCEQVEILVNGKSIGKKQLSAFEYFEQDIIYKPGKLEVRGFRGGKLVAKQLIETTGSPSKLSARSDTLILKADGRDVAIINMEIRDAKGRIVPTADNLIQFAIEGNGHIIGTGNGNPSSHEPDKSDRRKAFNGLCQVLVQSDKKAGKIKLKVISDSLAGDEVVITVN